MRRWAVCGDPLSRRQYIRVPVLNVGREPDTVLACDVRGAGPIVSRDPTRTPAPPSAAPCRCHISRAPRRPALGPPPARGRPIPQAIRLLRDDYAGGSCPPRQGGVGQYPERNGPCQAASGAIGIHDEPGLTTPVHATNVVFLWSVGGLTTFFEAALPLLTCSFPCREGGT